MSHSNSDNERERWNRKYSEDCDAALRAPDPFLELAFARFILPLFSNGGRAIDPAGGTGRHAIWLAQQGWEVTLIDISETGVERARQSAGPLASHIRFVVDDLTRFQASQTEFEARFDVVMAFFYLERSILSEIVKALRGGGLLVYKTYLKSQARLKNPAHLLEAGELLRMAEGLRILHYREVDGKAELVAGKVDDDANCQFLANA
jgi:SAM-dependent methyltransferase